MATSQKTVEYILDQLSDLEGVSAKKMFGEFTLYYQNKVVGLICNDQLFIKETETGRRFVGDIDEAPPYPGAKLCFRIGDRIEEREWLNELVLQSAKELPEVKRRKAGPKRG